MAMVTVTVMVTLTVTVVVTVQIAAPVMVTMAVEQPVCVRTVELQLNPKSNVILAICLRK